MNLIDKIKAIAKEGVDFGEIEAELKTLNPLNSVTDKAEAWNFIKSNPLLMSTFDSEQNIRSEKTVENYKAGKMLEEWKLKEEALRAEINPGETEAQKVAREFKEFKQSVESKEHLSALQDKLSIKAKELEFDPIEARKYSALGDDAAFGMLEQHAALIKKTVEDRVSGLLKDKYKSGTPRKPATIDSLSTLSDSELYGVSKDTPEMKQAVLDEVSRRMIPKN